MPLKASSVVFLLMESLVSATVVLGNGLILYTLYRHKDLRNPASHHIVSLAAADLLLGVGVIPAIALRESGGLPRHFYGCLTLICLEGMVGIVCTLSLTNLALERCLALVKPRRYQRLGCGRWSRVAVVLSWLLGSGLGLVPLVSWHRDPASFSRCSLDQVLHVSVVIYALFYGFFLPCMCLMSASCFIYWITLLHRSKVEVLHEAVSPEEYQRLCWQSVDLRGAHWLFLVVLLFVVFRTHLYIIYAYRVELNDHDFLKKTLGDEAGDVVLYSVLMLNHLNSMLNPYLYALSSPRLKFAMSRGLGLSCEHLLLAEDSTQQVPPSGVVISDINQSDRHLSSKSATEGGLGEDLSELSREGNAELAASTKKQIKMVSSPSKPQTRLALTNEMPTPGKQGDETLTIVDQTLAREASKNETTIATRSDARKQKSKCFVFLAIASKVIHPTPRVNKSSKVEGEGEAKKDNAATKPELWKSDHTATGGSRSQDSLPAAGSLPTQKATFLTRTLNKFVWKKPAPSGFEVVHGASAENLPQPEQIQRDAVLPGRTDIPMDRKKGQLSTSKDIYSLQNLSCLSFDIGSSNDLVTKTTNVDIILTTPSEQVIPIMVHSDSS